MRLYNYFYFLCKTCFCFLCLCVKENIIYRKLDSGIIDFRNLRLPDPSGSRGGPGNMYFFSYYVFTFNKT